MVRVNEVILFEFSIIRATWLLTKIEKFDFFGTILWKKMDLVAHNKAKVKAHDYQASSHMLPLPSQKLVLANPKQGNCCIYLNLTIHSLSIIFSILSNPICTFHLSLTLIISYLCAFINTHQPFSNSFRAIS